MQDFTKNLNKSIQLNFSNAIQEIYRPFSSFKLLSSAQLEGAVEQEAE